MSYYKSHSGIRAMLEDRKAEKRSELYWDIAVSVVAIIGAIHFGGSFIRFLISQ